MYVITVVVPTEVVVTIEAVVIMSVVVPVGATVGVFPLPGTIVGTVVG